MEDAALMKKELSEDIPNNIQDFRGHPVYVFPSKLTTNNIRNLILCLVLAMLLNGIFVRMK